jgi:hypothetical protein
MQGEIRQWGFTVRQCSYRRWHSAQSSAVAGEVALTLTLEGPRGLARVRTREAKKARRRVRRFMVLIVEDVFLKSWEWMEVISET